MHRISARLAGPLTLGVVILLGALARIPALAQEQYMELAHLFADMESHRQPPPGTEFVFARVRYTTTARKMGYNVSHRLEGWAHDYPVAEEHILQVADEATGINLNRSSYVIVELESDDIFRYPLLYFSEVGEMNLTEHEIANLREYFDRGGFAIVDDFDNQELLDWFQSQMQKVFPGRTFVRLAVSDPLFHTFYDIPTLNVEPPYKGRRRPGEVPTFYGYYNDQGRLIMIINHNNDIGDFWEWIDQPRYPLQPSTEGLRFGINYFIYALSH
jgi:uncharacterized protein DUF4159